MRFRLISTEKHAMSAFFRRSGRRINEERGGILILSALIMILLLAISAFATDLGAWYRQGQEQQRSADVSSLNAAQAYDMEFKNYLALNGPTLADLSPAEKAAVEVLAFDEAVDAIVSVLSSSGMSFASIPIPTYDPDPPNGSSTVTLTATDGTTIAITRNGLGEFIVTVGQTGKQYFSNVLRDAPEIERSATSVISNCNADCSREIEIKPPFTGFSATGSGDGYRPLLWGDDEIWAVNHHSNGSYLDQPLPTTQWGGDIICMDRNTTAACSGTGAHYPLNYQTAGPSTEYLSPTGQLYFAGRIKRVPETDSDVGLVCFDVNTRSYCPTPWTYMWDAPSVQRWNGWINGAGPWEYNNKLYSISVDGVVHCLDPAASMASCGVDSTSATSVMPANYRDVGFDKIQGEVVGSRLYFTITYNGTVFGCFDLATRSACGGSWNVPKHDTGLTGGGAIMTFMSYTTAGAHSGMCALTQNTGSAKRYACYTTTGGTTTLPNSTGLLADLVGKSGSTWAGSTFAWNNERTYFGAGVTDRTGCYDWTVPGTCAEGSIDHLVVQGTVVEPYHYAEVTPECIIGLGDESHFFSFNPLSMDTCTESSVSTDIWPCDCGDGVTKRWGVLELPPELLAVLNSAQATVSSPANPDLTGDLMAGPLDLSPLNGFNGPATLTIVVDSKTNPDGTLQWTQPYSAELSLVVQPTLTN